MDKPLHASYVAVANSSTQKIIPLSEPDSWFCPHQQKLVPSYTSIQHSSKIKTYNIYPTPNPLPSPPSVASFSSSSLLIIQKPGIYPLATPSFSLMIYPSKISIHIPVLVSASILHCFLFLSRQFQFLPRTKPCKITVQVSSPPFYLIQSSSLPQSAFGEQKFLHASMKQTTLYRRLLQVPIDEDVKQTTLSPYPVSQPINGSSETTTISRHYKPPASPLDSSMALTILVLLTAFFFMGFFSIYLRRYAQEQSADIPRRRLPSQPSSSSPGLPNNRKVKGLDPATGRALPLVSYGEDAKHLITDCPICLSEFEEKEVVKLIPHCKHLFHPHCLETWLMSHVSCPLCRSTQLFKKVDDQVCLDVKEVESSNAMTKLQGGSTVDSADTSSERAPVGVHRSCSCTYLGDPVVLHRSRSF